MLGMVHLKFRYLPTKSNIPVPFELLEKERSNLHQSLRPAATHQCFMKNPVKLCPLKVVALINQNPLFSFFKAVERGNDRRLPVLIPSLYRLGNRKSFK